MVTVRKLKGLMAENNMNQKDLAILLDVSKTTVHRKLTKKNDFSLQEAELLSRYFNKSVDEIFIIREKKKAS